MSWTRASLAGLLLAWLCAATGGCPTDDSAAPLAATVEDNPACAVSCVVRWTTDEPASSWVEFGEGDAATHRTGDDELVTEHDVIVVGMRQQRPYTLWAVSVTADGTELRSEALAFDTAALPSHLVEAELVAWDEERAEDGWTLTNLVAGIATEVRAVMLDMEGHVVWYYQHPDGNGRPDVTTYWLGDRVLLGGGMPPGSRAVAVGLDGAVRWEGPQQPSADDPFDPEALDGAMHHEFRPLDEGGYLTFLLHHEQDVEGDLITLLDEDGEPAWQWNAFDWLTPDPEHVDPMIGWTHFNSAQVDPDVLYVNSYSQDRVFKIDRADGHIHWVLGEGGDFAPDPDAADPWFGKAHALERLPGGTWLLYDNGPMARGYSRVVEYAVDEAARTTEIVWEYPGELADDTWYNYAWGDADLLPGGTVLFTSGIDLQGGPSRISEVTRDGELVWRVSWPRDLTPPYGSYAAERIPALAEEL